MKFDRHTPVEAKPATVYVQLRVAEWDPTLGKKGKGGKRMRHCRGLTVIFEKYTPAEVHKLIVQAGREAHERIKKAKEDRDASRSNRDTGPDNEPPATT